MTRISLKKKLLFFFVTVILVVFMIEFFSFVAFFIIEKQLFSFSKIHSEQKSQTDILRLDSVGKTHKGGKEVDVGKLIPPYMTAEVIHPYLGFVFNPEYNKITKGVIALNREIKANIPITEHGFVDSSDTMLTESDDKITIGIFGGSVAFWFSVLGKDSLISELKKSPIFSNKEIVVVRLASGGYKQPQQLIALNYFLALGAHFDFIINIDGVNEVALPIAENLPKKVFPFFPRGWFLRVQDLPDLTARSIMGEITYLKSKRSDWARVFSKAPFRYSITLNLIWKCYDRRLNMAINEDQIALQNYKPKSGSYAATGPSRHYESEDDLYRDLTSVWERSSLQMHRLSSANNIRYFHFLQPNIFVTGSKVLAQQELKLASDTHPYKEGAERGYPYLTKAGEELVNQGVNFHDLTMVFANRSEPIYVDCCHFNKTGNEILGTVIGQAIVHDINTDITRREK